MKKQDNLTRLAVIAAAYLVIALVFVVRLLYLQVSGQDYYTMSQPPVTYTRTVKIQAQRGEIYDRNGKAIVTNAYTYNLCLDYATRPTTAAAFNEMLLDIRAAAAATGESDALTQPKSSLHVTVTDSGLLFEIPEDFLTTARGRRYKKLVGELNVDDDADVQEQAEALMLYFGIRSREKNADGEYETFYNYTYDLAALLFKMRLDMVLSDFSAVEPYTVAEDVSLALITRVEEKFPRGLTVEVKASRVYNYPGYLSHVLGTIGKIPTGKSEYYTEQGYSYDAIVGRDGAEAAFEEYLRGQDGVMTITEDSYGSVLKTEITKEPVAGQDVYLTIDMDMQIVAEKALAENIFKIREEAKWSGKPLSGEDASSGAMTVLDCDTGEVLAIASYPTFNLATYGLDFNYLRDDETKPFLNRALNGTFAPGSTFKVGVAVAALSEGVIEKDTVIDAQGKYMYYAASGFTPRCWLYLMNGNVHGKINVVEAIQESCNYFFYDVGRQLTIEKMNEYGRHFGLGGHTGIELPESVGILAGPDYRNDNGLGKWSPGDTIQAAIGQSDNQFTPLQISSYIATILNGGKRYSCHILSEVREFGSDTPSYKKTPVIADSFDLDPDILATVKEGMKGVMDNGSAASVFSGYEISVGGKTGTAQVSDKKSDNGIMTAFAPFEDPEIVITCVIEQGSGGTEAGYSVRDVFDYYFKVDEIRAAKAAAEAAAEAAAAAEADEGENHAED
ncbi:MAG: hypothetical protein IJC71_03840 [Clostridia bacterium]|nr:hypothetical protein [Clostridia bacterium]